MSGSVSDYGGPTVVRPATKPLAPGNAASRYYALEGTRLLYQFRAIRFASLTLANLYRIIGANGSTDEITPWQSFGGYCVNNLTSKLMLSMFPPGIPFIRLHPSRKAMLGFAKMDPQHRGALKSEIDQALSMAEQEFVDGVAEDGDAATLTQCIKHLIVGGNYALQYYADASIRGIPFINWVVQRDKSGNLLEFCIRDQMVKATLPPDIHAMLNIRQGSDSPEKSPGADQTQVDLFTYGRWTTMPPYNRPMWHVYQECNGLVVPRTEHVFEKDALPFDFIPFNLLDGEHYGRSYVEDYEGDLQTLDGLEQSITEGTAAAARYITMVKPGGVTNKNTLAEAQNGDVISGDANDVASVESGKQADFQAGINRIEAKEERLARAFLLNSSTVRNAERVTTEEIRYTAQELQDALGGLYTSLVPTLQTPYARKKMMGLQRNGRMVYLPKGTVKAVMVTGAAALGRNTELQNLDALVSPQSPAAQQAGAGIINWQAYYSRRATALGVDQDNLVKTEEQLDQEQQQAQSAEMAKALGPQGIQAGASLMQEGMRQAGNAQQQANEMSMQQAQGQQQQPAQQ